MSCVRPKAHESLDQCSFCIRSNALHLVSDGDKDGSPVVFVSGSILFLGHFFVLSSLDLGGVSENLVQALKSESSFFYSSSSSINTALCISLNQHELPLKNMK